MKRKSGMTLMETSLTITLVAIMLLGLFELSQVQRNVVKRLQNNTTALFLLESIKNQINYELDNGATLTEVSDESLKPLISNPEWVIKLEPLNEGKQLQVSLHNSLAGRYGALYQLEVNAR